VETGGLSSMWKGLAAGGHNERGLGEVVGKVSTSLA
jgi:hypothetical protein